MAGIMKYIDSLIIVLTSFLLPLMPTLIVVTLLVIMDFITGLLASYKLKNKITSKGFKRTVIKIFLYQCCILVAALLENYIIQDFPIIKGVVMFIALTEAKSFFENVEICTGLNVWEKISTILSSGASKKFRKKK